MINKIISELQELVGTLQQYTLLDIEDVKKAEHEKLIERNELKLEAMEKLAELKQTLNQELAKEYKDGKDIRVYKDKVDNLESDLRKLYELNGRLGSIVLPVRQMYKDIIDEIIQLNGGSLVEIKA